MSGCFKSVILQKVVAKVTAAPKSVSHPFMLQEVHRHSSSQDACYLLSELLPPCHADIHYVDIH